jgi:hypothetical protein
MIRITITTDDKGDIVRICSDKPVELYWVYPHAKCGDYVYFRGGVEIGSKFVEEELKKHPISHLDDELCGQLPSGMPPGYVYHVTKAMKRALG